MLRCLQSWKRALGGMAGLVLLPVMLSAQTNGGNTADPAQAIKARQKAQSLLNEGVMDGWRKAAGYLEKAAALRAVDDPVAIDERVLAAELYNATRWLYRSQINLVAAADLALAQGRILASAEYLLKAAIVANKRHHTGEALALAKRAERLTRSPHLSAAEVASIRSRIALQPSKLVADR